MRVGKSTHKLRLKHKHKYQGKHRRQGMSKDRDRREGRNSRRLIIAWRSRVRGGVGDIRGGRVLGDAYEESAD
jgi:hypothetical protein